MELTKLNQQIRDLCAARGFRFRPWEAKPWDVGEGDSPHPPNTGGHESWPKAQKLRRVLIAELKAAAA